MARGKFITEFERKIIKVGVAHGYSAPAIARYLGRTKVAIYNHIEKMEVSDMMGGLPFELLQKRICDGIDASEAENGKT